MVASLHTKSRYSGWFRFLPRLTEHLIRRVQQNHTLLVVSILPGIASNPGAKIQTINGINISNNIVNPSNPAISQENTLRANFSSFLESVYIGIKIADNAPSPNKSRNKFGNLNAAKNISDSRPAP